jgi:hypothetical protein
MSKGIRESLDLLIDRIEALTPKTDAHSGYTRMRDGKGLTQLIEQNYYTLRHFDLAPLTMPQDDGMLGISTRKRVTLSLRVFYGIPVDNGYTDRITIEDTAQLIESLKQPDYNSSTTGIISLVVNPAQLQDITNELGEVRAHLLTIDFDLLYLEE